MRRWFAGVLLCLQFVSIAAAQDVLPTEPIYVGSLRSTTSVWLDDTTFIFETDRPSTESSRYPTFQYNVTTSELTELEASPFRFDPPPEVREHFQMHESPDVGDFYASPFDATVLYASRLFVECGNECNGILAMLGHYTIQPDGSFIDINNTYRPAFVVGGCGFAVHWSRTAPVAVLERYSCYGGSGAGLGFFGFDYPPLPISYLLDSINDDFYALSEDGSRLLYSTRPLVPDGIRWDQEQLTVWSATLPTDERPSLIPAGDGFTLLGEGYNAFAAANFVADDPDLLVFVGTEGLATVNMETGEQQIINPSLNTEGVHYGIFSPDNRHIAIINYDFEVYVLETGWTRKQRD